MRASSTRLALLLPRSQVPVVRAATTRFFVSPSLRLSVGEGEVGGASYAVVGTFVYIYHFLAGRCICWTLSGVS